MEAFIDRFPEMLFGPGPWFIAAVVFYLVGTLGGLCVGWLTWRKNALEHRELLDEIEKILEDVGISLPSIFEKKTGSSDEVHFQSARGALLSEGLSKERLGEEPQFSHRY